MDLSITGRHVEITKALREYAEKKMERFSRYDITPMQASFRLSVEKYRHMAEIVLWVNGRRILAKEETDRMYHSIDGAVIKIDRMLRKYKAKKTRHKSPASGRTAVPRTPPRPFIARHKQYLVPVLTLEEAVSRLGPRESGPIIFMNDDDETLVLLSKNRSGALEATELIVE